MTRNRDFGIILRIRPLGDTSLIVHWLSEKSGRIATVAKGARKQNSSFLGRLDLFYTAEFSFTSSSRSTLHHLTEVSLRIIPKNLRRSVKELAFLSYCVQLIELVTESDSPVPEIFLQWMDLVKHIEQFGSSPEVMWAFELRLLEGMGLLPPTEHFRVSGGGGQLLSKLRGGEFESVRLLRASTTQQKEVDGIISELMLSSFGRLPRSRSQVSRME